MSELLPMLQGGLKLKIKNTLIIGMTLIAWCTAFADNLSGILTLNGSNITIQDKTSQKYFPLKSLTLETQNILKKLMPGDFIAGTGSIINSEIVLDTIDFVGFKSLIGEWQSNNFRLRFIDFSIAQGSLPFEIFNQLQSDLKYSITPSENTVATGTWKIFLSSQNKVQIASLEFSDQILTLKFFNPDNGQLIKVLIFTRVLPPPNADTNN